MKDITCNVSYLKASKLRKIIRDELSSLCLKQFISESILSEALIDKIKLDFPDRADEWDEANKYMIKELPVSAVPKYLKWLANVSKHSQEPLLDIAKLFPDVERKKQKLGDIGKFKTPEDLSNALSTAVKGISKDEEAIHRSDAATVYESDKFLVVMPNSVEASCALGSGTTWCTARRRGQGENLFYNYITAGSILYYVISKEAEQKKWAISASNGEIVPGNNFGGATVTSNNSPFTDKEMHEVFGDEYDQIIDAILNHSSSIKMHPAEQRVREALTDVKKLSAMFKGLSADAAIHLIRQIDDVFGDVKKADDVSEMLDTIEINSIKKLATNTDVESRVIVSSNNKTPKEILAKLADDVDVAVRSGVTYNNNTPKETLAKLVNDTNILVRSGVASNINTPKEILAKLADDVDYSVRINVADNTNTPKEVLVKLADGHTRINVAYNTNTPKEVLAKLADDPDYSVRINVANNTNTPKEILIKLADDESDAVRLGVAYNTNTPKEILTKLANDVDATVRSGVAHNTNTPKEILAKLANDRDGYVRKQAKKLYNQ